MYDIHDDTFMGLFTLLSHMKESKMKVKNKINEGDQFKNALVANL